MLSTTVKSRLVRMVMLSITARPRKGDYVVERRDEYGSALTETFVLCTVMVPLAFTIPMIGKLADMRHTAVQSSRFVAWQEAHDPEGHISQAVLHERFYNSPDSPIQSAVPAAAVSSDNRLWGNASNQSLGGVGGDGVWEFATYTDQISIKPDQTLPFRNDSDLPVLASGTSQAIAGAAKVLEFADNTSWDVTTEGIANASVRVKADIGSLLAGFTSNCSGAGDGATESTLCLQEASSIMVDGWSAGSADEVSRRTRSFVPATVLKPVGEGLAAFGRLPVFKELRSLDDAFGRVDVTVLPLDRYQRE